MIYILTIKIDKDIFNVQATMSSHQTPTQRSAEMETFDSGFKPGKGNDSATYTLLT